MRTILLCALLSFGALSDTFVHCISRSLRFSSVEVNLRFDSRDKLQDASFTQSGQTLRGKKVAGTLNLCKLDGWDDLVPVQKLCAQYVNLEHNDFLVAFRIVDNTISNSNYGQLGLVVHAYDSDTYAGDHFKARITSYIDTYNEQRVTNDVKELTCVKVKKKNWSSDWGDSGNNGQDW